MSRATELNAIFALVLGLIAFIYLACIIAVIGVEVSVVLRRRLYPRALLTPFTDDVDLTEADRRAYDSYAKSMRHKGFQHVEVTFDDEVSYEPEFDTSAIPKVDPGHHPKPDPEQAPAEPSTTRKPSTSPPKGRSCRARHAFARRRLDAHDAIAGEEVWSGRQGRG